MKRKFKMNYLKSIYNRYYKSSKEEKKKILDEFCKNCGYNRKYAIRLLNDIPPDDRKLPENRRKRGTIYLKETIKILEKIWEASGYLWSERLKVALPLWISWAKRHFRIEERVEKQLLSISSRTIDRRLKDKKYRKKKRIYTCTKPGSLLKHQIPIKTDNWDVKKAGFIEADLVSHCGNSTEGDYISTLNCVDIKTTWIERRAIMGRGQFATTEAIDDIKKDLPFPLRGFDSDNDAPFINYHLQAYCEKRKIQFTRSRPYKKNDNAHIEQKNWTHVRKIFGYARYDTEEALEAMNDLYRNELRLFQNLFQPSVKLVKKTRIGSKVKRIYDKPKTPYQRVLESKGIDKTKVEQLKQLFVTLDPFELSEKIDKKLNKIYDLAHRRTRTKKTFTSQFKEEFYNHAGVA